MQFKQYKLKKAWMVCLGLESGAGGWKSQMNPLSYGGIPNKFFIFNWAKIERLFE